MILTEKLFKMRYRVGGSVKTPLLIHAERMEDADAAVFEYAADQEGYDGEEITILSASELNLEDL